MSTATTKILFIGNSYTHGAYEPAISFNKDAIHDLDETGSGGVHRFAHGAKNILALVREKSPGAKVYFYETWARPDKVYLDGASYRGEGLQAMQTDLHDSYLRVASLSKAVGLVLVGQSFLKAIEDGVAVVSPYNEVEDGKVDLWAHDHFHASKYGSYLSACTFFAAITGEDPSAIANGDGSPAASLGVEQEVATRLQSAVVRPSVEKPN